MAAVLVHIDLDANVPHPSSLVALAAGRRVASSWGATLYAALISGPDPSAAAVPGAAVHVVDASNVPGLDAIAEKLSRTGADKLVVALSDAPVAPLWALVGGAWQGVIDRVRPRLVLFGADAPSALELGPRTGARIGARLLTRACTIGEGEVELRDRDGGYVRLGDTGAAVALIGRAERVAAVDSVRDIDRLVLALGGGADKNVELDGSQPAKISQGTRPVVIVGDDADGDPHVTKHAKRLAAMLGGKLLAKRDAPLAPELCVLIGNAPIDVAGATSVIKIGSPIDKSADGALNGLADAGLAELVKRLESV